MAHASTAWSKAARILVVVLFAVNVYRAATQSMTLDESFTFNRHVDQSAGHMLELFDVNNHMVNTLLMRASVALFGVSELSVRIPSLLGGALYLAVALRLAFFLFGETWTGFLCLALLSLNPFILDFLSAARGYGMALAFLLVALDQMVRYSEDSKVRRLSLAGLALGLSVVCNMAFAPPGAVLGATFAGVVLFEGWRAGHPVRPLLWTLVDRFVLLGVVVAFVTLVLPLSRLSGQQFYYGAQTLAQALESIAFRSLADRPGGSGPDLLIRFTAVLPILAGALVLAVVVAGAAAIRHALGGVPLTRTERFLVLAGGAMGGTLALLAAARHAAGVLYPLDRTGIYWVPLFVLAYVALVERYARAPVPRVLAVAVAALFLSQFLLAFRTNCYGLWVFDAGTRHMVEILRARENGARPVRIAASWPLEPTLNFYRRMYGLTWLEPVTRESAELPGNYRALLPKDRGLVEKLGLTVLYEDPLAGSILAK